MIKEQETVAFGIGVGVRAGCTIRNRLGKRGQFSSKLIKMKHLSNSTITVAVVISVHSLIM